MRTTEQFVTAARPDTVWQVLADVEHWHNWTPTIQQIEPLDAGGLDAELNRHDGPTTLIRPVRY